MQRTHFAPPSVPQPTGRHSSANGAADILKTGFTLLKRIAETWMNRRAVVHLARHDDRMLEDIGLTRGDVDWALSHSLMDDPSLALAKRIERRRNAARWARRPGLEIKTSA